jgi:hypothetical protein
MRRIWHKYQKKRIKKASKAHQTGSSFRGGSHIPVLCYSTARSLIRGLGVKLNVHISPHYLWRYSATYAGRNSVPLEAVTKVILRHQDLKTAQVYLGKITDSEAIRWMDILYGK